jgi:AAA15 family ATPase/GTPase
MFLKEFYAKDKRKSVEIENIKFGKFNLLVGASGAGKSTVIESINSIIRLIDKDLDFEMSWKIVFLDNYERNIVWTGETIRQDLKKSSASDSGFIFKEESVFIDDINIATQNENSIYYNNNKLPDLGRKKA